MNRGFFGKILWIDLSDETFREEKLPEEIYRKYLGGYGLAAKIIYENMPKNVDPLGSEAILGFFPGLLTGTVAPLAGRYMICGKSPLTGTWANPNSGGFFGPEIKKCGFDGILVKGIANSPKNIIIFNDKKQILDGSDVWGLDTAEIEEKFKEQYGKVQVASIGQSGEKISWISGIVHDKGRIAARSGLGAVMGSKKLKALVLKGNKEIPIVDKSSLLKYTREYNRRIKSTEKGIIKAFKTFGTTMGNVIFSQMGDTPIRNWGGYSEEHFPIEKINKISSIEIDKYKFKKYGCFSCPVQCGSILKIPKLGIEETRRPEYENCAALGPLILNEDLMSIFALNDLCNRAGLDVISTGGTVAFAIECFENDLINKDDTNGLELTWGNSEAIVKLVNMIVNREGIGDILADGSKKASEKIGKGSEKYSITSLGSEIGMHNPRIYESFAFTYAFDPTPGNHNAASIDFMETMGPMRKFIKKVSFPRGWKKIIEKKPKAQLINTSFTQVINSVGLCLFSTIFGEYPFFELIHSLTGWDLTFDECLKIGLRIQNLRQAFTLREDIKIARNELNGRIIGNPPDDVGPCKDIKVDYKEFYKGYCREIGWNPENGYPLQETLNTLDLGFVIKDLYP
ncbi:MAG: aldehyde ferredoxin oxidoreductase family protein [Promethearchaeota archaeon]